MRVAKDRYESSKGQVWEQQRTGMRVVKDRYESSKGIESLPQTLDSNIVDLRFFKLWILLDQII